MEAWKQAGTRVFLEDRIQRPPRTLKADCQSSGHHFWDETKLFSISLILWSRFKYQEESMQLPPATLSWRAWAPFLLIRGCWSLVLQTTYGGKKECLTRKWHTFRKRRLVVGRQKQKMAKTHFDQASFWFCYFFQWGPVEVTAHQHVHLFGQLSNYVFHSKLVFGLEKRPLNVACQNCFPVSV